MSPNRASNATTHRTGQGVMDTWSLLAEHLLAIVGLAREVAAGGRGREFGLPGPS